MQFREKVLLTFVLPPLLVGIARAESPPGPALEEAGVTAGVVIHLGCGDGRLTARLHVDENCIVHGLDSQVDNVAEARAYLQSKGLYGPVSVDILSGDRLPYVDNLARAVVVSASCDVSLQEVERVLCPLGVAFLEQDDGSWKTHVASWPPGIDQWTHYLYDASNNAVAHDTEVGPPRYVQWTAGPIWTRNHHTLNSFSAAVTARGRLFYIFDRATAADMRVPSKWSLVCRDAFSGVKLWERPLESWASQSIRFRSGPPQLPRLMVASGDRLFVPLGVNKPISVLDAATGKTVSTLPATEAAEEIVLVGHTLLAVKGEPVVEHAFKLPQYSQNYTFPNSKRVAAVDVRTEEVLWESPAVRNIQPLTLAADGEEVYYQLGDGVICRDLQTGKERWRYGDTEADRSGNGVSYGTNTLVVADQVVLCNIKGTLHALSAEDGKELWRRAADQVGFHEPLDVFVIDGLVWLGCRRPDSGRRPAPPAVDDFSQGIDLRTGAVQRENSILADLQTVGHHHRCYREKATTRYIIAGKRGVEMMDLKGDDHSRNNWVRSSCQYGVLPANGLLYCAPHSCGCYMESKLRGLWALAAKRDMPPAIPEDERLTKGPAYGTIDAQAEPSAETWPTYRHDLIRSGIASTVVSDKLSRRWSTALSGQLTQPVASEGLVVTAATDRNTVYALDAGSGEVVWQFACGGRIDSPPTIYGNAVLFGSGDGRVYCLRLDDGELAWMFLAAFADLRCGTRDRVESVWPAHGSVLLIDGVAYCSAGRSTWLDGGIALYGLDPSTGEVLCSTRFESPHPEFSSGRNQANPEYQKVYDQNSTDYKTFLQPDRSDAFSMAGGAISDVLVSDGENVFLHHVMFDRDLRRQPRSGRHLFSTSSLLDDRENHRSHWVLGTGDFSRVPVAYSWIVNSPGGRRGKLGIAVPYGVILVYDDNAVWGVHRNGRADGNYVLFRRQHKRLEESEAAPPDFRAFDPDEPPYPYQWQENLSLRPRAIVKSGSRLFLAAQPTEIPPNDPHAAYEGRLGGVLAVFDAEAGAKLSEYELPSPVVWDGMCAANERLYAATLSGKVVCYEEAVRK